MLVRSRFKFLYRWIISDQSVYCTSPHQDCKNDNTANISIELIDNSPFHLRGSFQGPQDSLYESGHFELVSYSDIYQSLPPKHLLEKMDKGQRIKTR